MLRSLPVFLILLSPTVAAAVFNSPHGPNGGVQCLQSHRNGSLLVGGVFSSWHHFRREGLVRLTADGAVDAKFDAELSRGGSVRALALTVNEKGEDRILVAGAFSEVHGKKRRFLARVKNEDGSNDGEFDPGGGPDGPVYAIAQQKDGKIIIGGAFAKVNGVARRGVARLMADGKLDATFHPKEVDGTVNALVLSADGQIYLGGTFGSVGEHLTPYVARLHGDGTLDSAFVSRFTMGARGKDGVFALALDGKDRLVTGGHFQGASQDNLARLEKDGAPDKSFKPGPGMERNVHALLFLAGGRLIVGGAFEQRVLCLAENGSIDKTFKMPSFDGAILAVERGKTSQSIFVAGNFFEAGEQGHNTVAKLDANGKLDPEYARTFGGNDRIDAIAALPGGKFLVAGYFSALGGRRQSRVARLRESGKLDPDFGKGLSIDGAVKALAVRGDGKAFIAGDFRAVNGQPQSGIARLNPDGTLDVGFFPDFGPNVQIHAIAAQSDGKVVVGGENLSVNGMSLPNLIRLNEGGSVDVSYRVGSATNGPVTALAIQAGDRALVGGFFSNFNGVPRRGLARVLPDGTADSAFDTGLGVNGKPHAIVVQPDGKIVLGGQFTSSKRRNVARFLPNGDLDESFKTGSGANLPVEAVLPWKKNRLLVAGPFVRYDEEPRQHLAVLKENGSLSSDFEDVTLDGAVLALAPRPEWHVLVGGAFTTVNGTTALRFVELDEDGKTAP